ncbi:MAG TPA: glycosyltransferase family 2 protein [Candidatus Acidoferrales bacterium]|nr:glycosyltransferase family 2 protein [Candidatus Acidoferrales bacterium]
MDRTTAASAKNHVAYALVTPAWNEEALIDLPIRAVIAQTIPPRRYVVVSDGSTDRTDEIVQSYSAKYPFVQLYRMPERHKRSFAAQVDAINAGYEQIRNLEFDFVGNLDADITFEPDYFERLFQEFQKDRRLGMAGGTIHDKKGDELVPRRLNRPHSVMHGVQMFRRECFDALGGYTPLPHGSPDWHAEVSLRMRGWDVRSIPGLRAVQHRPNGGAGSFTWYFYRQGLADYSLGTHPLFELFKVARRIPSRPYILGGLAELAGFIHAYCRRDQRAVPDDFVQFLRHEQLGRLHLPVGRKTA